MRVRRDNGLNVRLGFFFLVTQCQLMVDGLVSICWCYRNNGSLFLLMEKRLTLAVGWTLMKYTLAVFNIDRTPAVFVCLQWVGSQWLWRRCVCPLPLATCRTGAWAECPKLSSGGGNTTLCTVKTCTQSISADKRPCRKSNTCELPEGLCAQDTLFFCLFAKQWVKSKFEEKNNNKCIHITDWERREGCCDCR